MMLSVVFACLLLVSYTQADDQWKEALRQRIARNTGTLGFSWPGFNWRRTTTQRIQTHTSGLPTKLPPTVAPTAGPSTSFTTFQNEALAQTNKRRAEHCAQDLILNSTLNAIAQAYAAELVSLGRLEHSKGKYGENLYMTKSLQGLDVSSLKGRTY